MVLAVADEDVARAGDGDALEALELSVARAPRAEGAQESAVRVEDLDAIVARVGYADVPLIVYSYTPRELKLPLLRALATEAGEHPSIDVEDLDAMVVGVRDQDSVRTGDGDVVWVLQLTGLTSKRAELAHECAI